MFTWPQVQSWFWSHLVLSCEGHVISHTDWESPLLFIHCKPWCGKCSQKRIASSVRPSRFSLSPGCSSTCIGSTACFFSDRCDQGLEVSGQLLCLFLVLALEGPLLMDLSATGPGASMEDRSEETGDCLQAPDSRHHRGKDLPPVSTDSCGALTKKGCCYFKCWFKMFFHFRGIITIT